MSHTIETAAPAPKAPEHAGEEQALTYAGLRNLIGGAGFALPVVLLGTGVVDGHLQKSMSAYYYTDIGNYFTGTLCIIGIFLVAYRFGDKVFESVITTVAGIAAFGVAFFHCLPSHPTAMQRHLSIVHLSCAGVLFFILGLMSFWFFAEHLDPGERRNAKLTYQALGALIWVSIALMFLWNALDHAFYDRHGLLFWLETVCVVAFSASFTIKGRFLPRATQLAAAAAPALRRRGTARPDNA